MRRGSINIVVGKIYAGVKILGIEQESPKLEHTKYKVLHLCHYGEGVMSHKVLTARMRLGVTMCNKCKKAENYEKNKNHVFINRNKKTLHGFDYQKACGILPAIPVKQWSTIQPRAMFLNGQELPYLDWKNSFRTSAGSNTLAKISGDGQKADVAVWKGWNTVNM